MFNIKIRAQTIKTINYIFNNMINNLNENDTLSKLKALVEHNNKFVVFSKDTTSKHYMNHTIHVICSMYYCGGSYSKYFL